MNMNALCCDLLNAVGYDGEQFWIKIKHVDRENHNQKLTQPNTRERQDAMAEAKSQFDLFSTTAGATLNGNNYFISGARTVLYASFKKLQRKKGKS
jgi:hypothetical protein